MKPANWDQMTDKQKKNHAMNMLESQRGSFILSQALYLGAKALREVPEPRTEVSNAEDMDILQEVFGLYRMVKGIEANFGKISPKP
jgi:hypothetical protein